MSSDVDGEVQQTFFSGLTNLTIANTIRTLIKLRSFFTKKEVVFYIPALECRGRWDTKLITTDGLWKVAMERSSIVLNLLLYPDENNRKKALNVIQTFEDYSELPAFHHEVLTAHARRLIKDEECPEVSDAEYTYSRLVLTHEYPGVNNFLANLDEHLFHGLGIPGLLISLKRHFVSYHDYENQLACAYSPSLGIINKEGAIKLSLALQEQGHKLITINQKIPPLPPRSKKEGTYIAVVQNVPIDVAQTDKLKWNDNNPPPGEPKKKQRSDSYHLMKNTEGNYISVTEKFREITVVSWNANHPKCSRLRKQVISCVDASGDSIGPHVLVWTWKSAGYDHPKPSPHKNSKTNKNNYQKNHKSAIAEARAKQVRHPVPTKQLYQTLNAEGKTISMRAAKTATLLARPNDFSRDKRCVKTEETELLTFLESLEGTVYSRFLSTRVNPEDVINLVVLDTRLATVAAAGQLTSKQLHDRKELVHDTINNHSLDELIRDGVDKSGVFYEHSAVWVMDTTYNLCDYFITVIAFESGIYRTAKSKKRSWLPLAYICHKQEDSDFFLRAFRELEYLIKRHCPELATKKAACLITDDQPAFQEIFNTTLFEGATHILCDFHFLRNAKRRRNEAERSNPSSGEEDSDPSVDPEETVKARMRKESKGGLSRALFGIPRHSSARPDEATKFTAGAIWGTTNNLKSVLLKEYENGEFTETEYEYALKNASKLIEKHGAYGRLMSGRITLFITSNHIEYINRRLKEQLCHKRVVLQKLYKVMHEFLTAQYMGLVFAVTGRPGSVVLNSNPIIPFDEMDDDEGAKHFEKNGLAKPTMHKNFDPPVPPVMLAALAGRKTTKFISENQDYWTVKETEPGLMFVYPKKGKGKRNVGFPVEIDSASVLKCGNEGCGKKACIHVIMAMVNLPERFNHKFVCTQTERHYLKIDMRLFHAKNKADGTKPGTRTFSHLSGHNGPRPILDKSSSLIRCREEQDDDDSFDVVPAATTRRMGRQQRGIKEAAYAEGFGRINKGTPEDSFEELLKPCKRRRSLTSLLEEREKSPFMVGLDTSDFMPASPVRETKRERVRKMPYDPHRVPQRKTAKKK